MPRWWLTRFGATWVLDLDGGGAGGFGLPNRPCHVYRIAKAHAAIDDHREFLGREMNRDVAHRVG